LGLGLRIGDWGSIFTTVSIAITFSLAVSFDVERSKFVAELLYHHMGVVAKTLTEGRAESPAFQGWGRTLSRL
jgi:hypothetical protein